VIYSKKNDFLFIKGRKVAGTSVEMALATVCGPEDIITLITPIDELERLRLGGRGAQNYCGDPAAERAYLEKLAKADVSDIADIDSPRAKFRGHMWLREVKLLCNGLPTDRIFCVERCPYAKIISSANMSGRFEQYKRDGQPMELNIGHLVRVIENKFEYETIGETRNINQYRDANGDMRLRVLRYESLTEQFAQLMAEYGISPAPILPHAKQGANSSALDPRTIFTRQQLDKINEIYAEEFDAFGYERL